MSNQYPSAPLLTDAQYGKFHKVDNGKSELYTTIRNTTSKATNTDKSVKMGSDAYFIEVRRSQKEEYGHETLDDEPEYLKNDDIDCCSCCFTVLGIVVFSAIFGFILYMLIKLSDELIVHRDDEYIANVTNITNSTLE